MTKHIEANGDLLTARQMKSLEAEADALLSQDAISIGMSKTGKLRSMTKYRDEFGLSSTHHTKVEKTHFTEDQLSSLAHTRRDVRHSKKYRGSDE